MANISGFGNGIVAATGLSPSSNISVATVTASGAVSAGAVIVSNGGYFQLTGTANFTANGYTDISATPGNGTINSSRGRFAFAAAGTSVTITCSACTAASMIICSLATNDTTALIKNVVPAAGSYTVTLNAAATGTTKCDVLVIF